jgi:hypothetical protein
MKKPDPYYTKARLFPAILTAIPLLVFVNTEVTPAFRDSLKEISASLPLITGFGLSAALVFLCVQVNRFISKEIFQKFIFEDETNMPTTYFLLWKNDFFADTSKTDIRKKIGKLFQMQLPGRAEEAADEANARKEIVLAVSQIRNKLRDNAMLLQHNIEFGFIRNLIGGSALAELFSILIFLVAWQSHGKVLMSTGIILMVIYQLPLLFCNSLIKRFGEYYAKVLYEQFLSI